jgi:ATP-dependent helicase/nuclease subunit A
MAPVNLTREQQLAVESKGLVMVSASAGSGKTHTMLERIMHLIENGVGLDRMLILVYNEANASELREKIRQKLFEKVCETVGDSADMYRKQLDEIAFSTICTIHAFCRTAIRKNFEVIGVNPDFDILDENAHKVYMSRALDKTFEEFATDDVFVDMMSIFEVRRSEDNLRANIMRLYERLDVQSNVEQFVKNSRECYVSQKKFDDIIFGHAEHIMKKVDEMIDEVMPQLIIDKQDQYRGFEILC